VTNPAPNAGIAWNPDKPEGWLGKLLTHPVKGLENYQQLMQTLTEAKGAIKVYCEVAPLE